MICIRSDEKPIRYVILITIILSFLSGYASAEEKKPIPNTLSPSPALFPLRFFAKTLSRADGNRCPLHPTCSGYSMETFEKHGLIMGWIMTCDRLIRCGRDELKKSPTIRVKGVKKRYDPVENNDFWWTR
ncbi:membrane protein insertion efficiency factor YidD [Thermodesulfobacteriota bacterium]